MSFHPLAIQLDYRVVFEHIKPPEASAAMLWWMLTLVLCLILLFVLYDIASRHSRKKRAMEKSAADFDQLALMCRLTPDEVNLLRHLIGVCGIKFPGRLFTTFELFNRCLEEEGPASASFVSEADATRLRIIRNKIFFGERSQAPPIRTTHELKSNQRLHLKKISSGEVFIAPVVEAGASGLLVATPRVDGAYLRLEAGAKFDVYFWRDRDASYHFESEVIGQTGAHLLITVLKHVEDIERIQRRHYHRINTSIQVSAVPVRREELETISYGGSVATQGHPGLRAFVVDISGAGFALATRTPLAANDLIYLEIPGAEARGAKIPIIGKILNVTKREATDESLMHAEFAGLSADSHERIFQLIYGQSSAHPRPAF